MSSNFTFLVSSIITGVFLFGSAELLRAVREIAINSRGQRQIVSSRGRATQPESYRWLSVVAVVCTLSGALHIAVGIGFFIFR